MALTDSLISYWKMDEASGDALDAHGANTLTDNNTVTSAAGKINTARQFTAANSEYFSHADNADLSAGDIDFTFAAWVYLDSKSSNRVILAKDGGSGFEYFFLYRNSVDRFQWEPWGVGHADVNADNLGSPSTGTWYHVVCWHDSVNNLVGISVNAGTANTTSYSGGVSDDTGTFRIGNDSFSEFWDGRIDEVGFWKRVLTSQERTDLYNGGAGLDYSSFGGAADVLLGQACL